MAKSILIILAFLAFTLAFQAGYVLGRHELSPIVIEKNSETLSP